MLPIEAARSPARRAVVEGSPQRCRKPRGGENEMAGQGRAMEQIHRMAAQSGKRALIAGGGAVAIDHHLPRLRSLLGLHTVRVVEVDPHRRNQLQRLFRRNPRVTISTDIDPHEHFDLAVIATPPKFHSDYYHQLLEQTDRFLIEKPLASSVAKAESLFESARDHGRPIFVNLIRRTLSGYRLIRDFYRSGHFGELQQVKIAEGGVFNWNAVSLGSFSKELNGGGVLMDTGPHTLDLLLQVFDDLELDAAWTDASANGVEANCNLQISADGVIPVSLILSRNRVLSNIAEFHFADATCSLSVVGNAISVYPVDHVEYQILPADVDQVERPSFSDLFNAFYNRYLLGDAPNDVGPEESLKALRLIESAYAHAQPIRGGF